MKRALCSFSLVFGVCGFLAGLQTANADNRQPFGRRRSYDGSLDPSRACSGVVLEPSKASPITVGPTDAWQFAEPWQHAERRLWRLVLYIHEYGWKPRVWPMPTAGPTVQKSVCSIQTKLVGRLGHVLRGG